MHSGIFLALVSYMCWGLLPLYIRLVGQTSAVEIVCHRVLWSFAVLLGYLLITRRFGAFRREIDAGLVWRYAAAAVLISLNWGGYIWGATHGRVLEVSLGYFIMPIFSVALGRIFLNERPNRLQWTGVAAAVAGVVYLCARTDAIPWVGFIVAVSFGLYGLVKKQAPLSALSGLTLETMILVAPALAAMAWLDGQGELVFAHGAIATDLLLAGMGPVTVVPLLLFAAALQRAQLSLIGMLQYLTPTLQFIIGFAVFAEPLSAARLWGFVIIWIGLALYVYGMLRALPARPGPARSAQGS